MAGYQFTLPTTGAFFFSSYFSVDDQNSSVLSAASNHRAQLREVLKALKRSTEKDILGVIKTVEDYLPYLFTIYHASTQGHREDTGRLVDESLPSAINLTRHQKIIVDWRSTFYDNKIPGKAKPRMEFEGLEYEVTFVLLTYAYALSNYSILVMNAANTQRAVELLTKAAGVFAYLNTRIAPLYTGLGSKQSPEGFTQFSACLTNMTLGQAQLNTLRQLEGKASHAMSCRIAVGAADHFSTAAGVLGSHPMSKAIPMDFRNHIVKSQKFALARAYQFLALEQEAQGKVGLAVACAQFADTLSPLDPATTTILRELTKENQHVTFQSVASQSDVQAILPSGREFVKASPFVPLLSGQTKSGTTTNYAASDAYY